MGKASLAMSGAPRAGAHFHIVDHLHTVGDDDFRLRRGRRSLRARQGEATTSTTKGEQGGELHSFSYLLPKESPAQSPRAGSFLVKACAQNGLSDAIPACERRSLQAARFAQRFLHGDAGHPSGEPPACMPARWPWRSWRTPASSGSSRQKNRAKSTKSRTTSNVSVICQKEHSTYLAIYGLRHAGAGPRTYRPRAEGTLQGLVPERQGRSGYRPQSGSIRTMPNFGTTAASTRSSIRSRRPGPISPVHSRRSRKARNTDGCSFEGWDSSRYL